MNFMHIKKAWLQSVGLFSVLLLSKKKFIFPGMDKLISWQRLVSVFICFVICGQREKPANLLDENSFRKLLTHSCP